MIVGDNVFVPKVPKTLQKNCPKTRWDRLVDPIRRNDQSRCDAQFVPSIPGFRLIDLPTRQAMVSTQSQNIQMKFLQQKHEQCETPGPQGVFPIRLPSTQLAAEVFIRFPNSWGILQFRQTVTPFCTRVEAMPS